MQVFDKHTKKFLQTTCKQIKYKSIHKSIADELLNHIQDQKNEYLKQGMDEERAAVKAVEQMGDPILVGQQLDKAHRPRTEWSVLLLAAFLVVLGGAVQFVFSIISGNYDNMFARFLLYAPIGIAAFAVTYFFDYTLIGRYSKAAFGILYFLTIIGFFVFNRTNGAHLHVYYSILLFIPVFAAIIYGYRNRGYLGIIASGLFFTGAAFICLIAPRLTGLFLFTVCCIIILTVAIIKGYFGVNKKVSLLIVYVPVFITLTGLAAYMIFSPHIGNRLSIMINPQLDPQGAGYQHLLARKLLSSSKLFGEAVIESNTLNQLIPGWSTDFSLTYIISRFGYVAGLVIVIMTALLIVRMFISVLKQKNACGFLVSFAACTAIAGQFVLYVLSNAGVIVLSGTLPLISFGGMGFITNMILIGLVLSVYRRTDIVNDRLEKSDVNRRLVSCVDGKLVIDLWRRSSGDGGEEPVG